MEAWRQSTQGDIDIVLSVWRRLMGYWETDAEAGAARQVEKEMVYGCV